MSDTRKPRALSGEIMTAEGRVIEGGSGPRTPAPDIVDADYETLDAASRGTFGTRASRPAAAPVAGLDMLKPCRQAAAERRRERGGALFWTTSLVVVFTAFWISGGHALVGKIPFLSAARPAAVRVATVTSRIEKQADGAVLFVDGEAVNDAADSRPVPPLSVNVLGNDGRTTRYLLGTNDSRLAPGERFSFSSRLIAPNAGVKSVSVTIEEQQD